ncbi:MAG TPA: VOC family protein [Aggregatilinea sp.]|jgi:catechol 2,3-dioxygenase-like lactoylglutathione lyase family enzyme|uniref:VOC family protein n=1 Tax=Aggregatilinea sp. TaxID=2806333 RepID=UPI002CFD43F9|nr:VOC family protein [Aggregatilinea sp.]HML23731.1 VOC family protein [Aggregatilinea sp.]
MSMHVLRVVRRTADFDAMLHFYRDLLGMTPVTNWDRPGDRGAILSPVAGAPAVEFEIMDTEGWTVEGVKPSNIEVSIEVDDADAWMARLAGAGVPIARGLENTPWGHRSFGIDDPDGLRLWLYHVFAV